MFCCWFVGWFFFYLLLAQFAGESGGFEGWIGGFALFLRSIQERERSVQCFSCLNSYSIVESVLSLKSLILRTLCS